MCIMTPDALQQALAKLIKHQYKLAVDPLVTQADPKFGDYTSNVAFQLSGKLKKAPGELAQELADSFNEPEIATIEATRAGYLNFTLPDQYWLDQLKAIDSRYGQSKAGKGTKVQIEFISANPTGPTTIGNARGGFIGDILARVYESQGYDVTREYYFNNAGTQIKKLVESVKHSAGLLKVKADEIQYRGAYVEDLAKEFKTKLKDATDDEAGELLTAAILKRYIEPAIKKMGIKFDVWFNERDLIEGGQLDDVIKRLKAKKLVFEKDGAIWLDTKKLGVSRQERVLVKSSGDPTYLAPDIAYHDDLFRKRGFDRSITVLGADHIDQFPSVKAATLALNPGKDMAMAGHQWFRLVKDGKEVKVSKRLGQYVTIEELIDEVTEPVARFFTIMRSADSHMDFDLDLAKEDSQKNPYHYVMYAYVRAQSILAKAKTKHLKPMPMTNLLDVERRLVRQMTSFPEVLEDIVGDFGVHRLTFYGQELARTFHEFYEIVPILSDKGPQVQKRLGLVSHFAQLMEAYWDVLGIEPAEKM